MNKKQLYVSPTINVFVVQTEGIVCTSKYGAIGAAGLAFSDANGNINDYTDFDF